MCLMNIFGDHSKMAKIHSVKNLTKEIQRMKKQGSQVGLCVGAFDLLHPGHIKHIEAAKKHCHYLVVAVTADKQVKAKKGAGRPIFNEKLRAYLVSQLKPVDAVIINRFDPATGLILNLKPSLYIKGKDYIKNIDWRLKNEIEVLRSVGGKIKFTRTQKLSSTDIIKYIKNEVRFP